MLFLAFSVGGLFMAVIAATSNDNYDTSSQAAGSGKTVLPRFRKEDFVNPTAITNKYFSLPKEKTIIFEKTTPDGMERVQIRIPGTTKNVMGVKTLVYEDSVWLDMNDDGKFDPKKELVEFTKDYLAQDKNGNVWYFGEDVVNYNYDDNGKLVDTDNDGSWLAGTDPLGLGEKAKPGIWFLGDPKKGDSVYQEFYADEAEDETKIVATGIKVRLDKPAKIDGKSVKEFTGCIQTLDTTALDAESVEDKFYCPQAGGLVKVYHQIKKETLHLKQVTLDDDSDEDDEN